MDPITHGIIGGGIYALSNNPVSLSNPGAVAAILGAMSPDLDIVIRSWGNLHYLKHHRGASHSLVGMAFFSLLITSVLSIFYSEISFLSTFIAAFVGAFSHTFFDCLNSYGAKLFWPVLNKKVSANLLMLYDPLITLCALVSIFITNKPTYLRLSIIGITAIYLLYRRHKRNIATNRIREYFNKHMKVDKLIVMPAMMAIYKWDFNLRTKEFSIVGQYNHINKKISVIKKFRTQRSNNLSKLRSTKLWTFFKDFSPSFHVVWESEESGQKAKLVDLRYYFRNSFMHHGTAVFNEEDEIEESIFHPYSVKNQIKIAE